MADTTSAPMSIEDATIATPPPPSPLERLLSARREGDEATVRALVVARRDNATASELLSVSDTGNIVSDTPLSAACQHGRLTIVRTLLELGADANTHPTGKRSPLRFAVDHGHTAIVSELIAHGADSSATDMYGWTALHTAAQLGHVAIAAALAAHGANVNAGSMARASTPVFVDVTPLYLATNHGRDDVAALLLEHGADIRHTTANT